MSKITALILTFALALSFCFVGFSCKNKSNETDSEGGSTVEQPSAPDEPQEPSEPIELKEPSLSDITVNLLYKPCGFYIGKGTLTELKIGGVKIPEENYTISNGYLILLAASWQDSGFAAGDNELIFKFSDYGERIITVTAKEDEKPIPGGSLTSKENLSVWQITDDKKMVLSYDGENAEIKLARITDNDGKNALSSVENVLYINSEYIKQVNANEVPCISFDINIDRQTATTESLDLKIYATETLKSLAGGCDKYEFATDGKWYSVVVDIEKFISSNANSKYFALVIGGKSGDKIRIKNWKTDTQQTLDFYKSTKLIPDYGFFEENVANWKAANTEGIRLTWSDEENALCAYNKGAADYGSDRRDLVIYTSSDFMKLAELVGYKTMSFKVVGDEIFTEAEADRKGLRVFSKANAGRDDGRINNGGATGVKVYKNFGSSKNEKEFEVIIDLKEFLDLNRNAGYMGIVCSVPMGGHVAFSNLAFSKDGGKTPEQELIENNIFSESYVSEWCDIAGNTKLQYAGGKTYFTVNAAGSNLTSRNHVDYISVEYLKKASAAGFTTMSFKVTGDDAFAAYAGKGIRVYNKADKTSQAGGRDVGAIKDGTEGVKIYKDFGTEEGEKEFIVTINIDEFFALNPEGKYMAFVLSAPQGSILSISDFALK